MPVGTERAILHRLEPKSGYCLVNPFMPKRDVGICPENEWPDDSLVASTPLTRRRMLLGGENTDYQHTQQRSDWHSHE